MKQSKYSKRRPANSAAFYQRDLRGSLIPRFTVKPKKDPIRYLSGYEVGVFVDDERTLQACPCTLPACDEWIILRSYSEVADFLESSTREKKESMFISFDHYLSKRPGAPSGNDCLEAFYHHRDDLATIVDIQGHSSDGSKNSEKLQRWYGTDQL